MKKNLKKQIVALLILAVTVFAAIPVSAESTKLEAAKSYAKLYRTKLVLGKQKYGVYTYPLNLFTLVDINQDGTPELICKYGDANSSFGTIFVYTVYNNKRYFCGAYGTRTQKNIKYSKKDKGIYDSWWTNTVAGSGQVTYGLSLKKKALYKVRYAYEQNVSSGSSEREYRVGAANRKVAKSKYQKYVNTYFAAGRFTTYTFVTNNAANRAKVK